MEQSERCDSGLRMPYVPGASEIISVVPPSCLQRNSCSSEKRDYLHGGELALFPVDPKIPLAEVLNQQVPVIEQLFSRLSHDEPDY